MDDELLYYTAICLYIKTRKKKKKWCRQMFLNRTRSSHNNLLKDLSLNPRVKIEPSEWRTHLRMDDNSYLQLLGLITPLIKKKDTVMRQCIAPNERLAATLHFLSTGMNYEELKMKTQISSQRLGVIIPETCRAILKCLKDYMKVPESQSEWKRIAQDFENTWNFPHCLGAIDGKHVRITLPHGTQPHFWNYMQFHSVILLACANSNYEFIWCEVDSNCRISDGDSIKNTSFYEKLMNGGLDIPPPETVGESKIDLPYVFVSGEAFDLEPNFIKPYTEESLNAKDKIFNYRLSKAQRTVEIAFGILTNRFRIFHTGICLALPKIEIVILTCCVLHNYLQRHSPGYITKEEMNDPNFETTLTVLSSDDHQDASNHRNSVREMFSDYFEDEGSSQLAK